MKAKDLIPVHEFCACHKIEFSFINSLNELGLIEVTAIEETRYINKEQMRDLEKMIRLHYDLDINIEGIDAISNLLLYVDNLQGELMALKNRLRLYEDE